MYSIMLDKVSKSYQTNNYVVKAVNQADFAADKGTSIQPFANVVGDYTCQNRKHKRRNYIHNNAPPFRTCIRGGSLAIVSCLGLFVYKKNKMLKYWFFSHLTAWDHIRVSVADLIFFVNCTSCFKFCSAQPTL